MIVTILRSLSIIYDIMVSNHFSGIKARTLLFYWINCACCTANTFRCCHEHMACKLIRVHMTRIVHRCPSTHKTYISCWRERHLAVLRLPASCRPGNARYSSRDFANIRGTMRSASKARAQCREALWNRSYILSTFSGEVADRKILAASRYCCLRGRGLARLCATRSMGPCWSSSCTAQVLLLHPGPVLSRPTLSATTPCAKCMPLGVLALFSCQPSQKHNQLPRFPGGEWNCLKV